MGFRHSWIILFCVSFPLSWLFAAPFKVGAGIADITGPASNLMMNGYVRKEQKTGGIHLRLHARAFVIEDETNGKTVALVNTELCNLYEGVKGEVIQRLQKKLGTRFSHENVHISANHTHSGPGGYSHHKYYNFRVGGFSKENFEVLVSGIAESILIANENLEPSRVFVGQGEVENGNINRSMNSYKRNPKSERDRYKSHTDTTMTVLKFVADSGKELGIYTWYPVHNTSMDFNNLLISSDNKGVASYLMEAHHHRDYRRDTGYVAAFANANAGDVSPGVAKDVDGNGDWECAANENFACTYWSGNLQYESAKRIKNATLKELNGLDYRHVWVDFSRVRVLPPFVKSGWQTTCPSGIGISMLAGSSEDGPGVGKEGVNCDNISVPLKGMCRKNRCHGKKPIVLQTGERNPPTTPQVMPVQLFRLGSLAIVGVPAEFTTMAGRRLREQVQRELKPLGVETAVIGGYANSFTSYVTTREEYQNQDYEGASTHFGEWTLSAYQQTFSQLTKDMVTGVPTKSDIGPARLPKQKSFVSASLGYDKKYKGRSFGSVWQQPKKEYKKTDTVAVWFVGSQLSHDPRLGGSYIEIQREEGAQWVTEAHDWDLSTRLIWRPERNRSSLIGVYWDTKSYPSGRYRVVYHSKAKISRNQSLPFQGVSRVFHVN